MTDYPFDSALGDNPTCDVCGKYVKTGERVKQTIIGVVTEWTRDYIDDEKGDGEVVELGMK